MTVPYQAQGKRIRLLEQEVADLKIEVGLLRAALTKRTLEILPPARDPAGPHLAPIAMACCGAFNVHRTQLHGPDRGGRTMRARLAFYLLAEARSGLGPMTIARWLGRDHTTVRSGIRRAHQLRASDPAFAGSVDRAQAQLDRPEASHAA